MSPPNRTVNSTAEYVWRVLASSPYNVKQIKLSQTKRSSVVRNGIRTLANLGTIFEPL